VKIQSKSVNYKVKILSF